MSRRNLSVLLFIVLALVVSTGAAFAQAGDTKQVGIVVTFPEGAAYTEVVTVPSAATAVEALKASKLNVVTAESSFGPAVCKINDTGCPVDNCFCDAETFWAYYHLNGAAWAPAQEGVGVYTPANGAVEGFAWSKSDANFNPTVQPPVFTFDQLAAKGAQGTPVLQIVALALLVVAAAVLFWWVRRMRRRAA